METMSFALRNIKRYLREPGTITFSFLSVFIVVGLYIFFMADMQIKNSQAMMGQFADMDQVIIHWILGGLVCIPAISVPLMILSFKVDDVVDCTQDDFFVTSAKRVHFVLGYILSTFIVGLLMTLLTLLLGELFIVAKGGQFLSLNAFAKVTAILALTIFSFSGFCFFIITFLKSKSSLTILNVILNTLIGFFAGLYVPLGMLSDSVSNVIKLFPLAQVAGLLRQILMDNTINTILKDVPSKQLSDFKIQYGIDLVIGGHLLTPFEILTILVIFGMIFYICSIVRIKRSKK